MKNIFSIFFYYYVDLFKDPLNVIALKYGSCVWQKTITNKNTPHEQPVYESTCLGYFFHLNYFS